MRAARAGELDRIVQLVAPLDVLAQQVVAEAACEDWQLDELFNLFRRATPVPRPDPRVLPRDRRHARHRHRPMAAVEQRPSSTSTASTTSSAAAAPPASPPCKTAEQSPNSATSASSPSPTRPSSAPSTKTSPSRASPATSSCSAIPPGRSAASSRARCGWSMPRARRPTIPFWLGEAPGRTIELSQAVGRLRRDVASRLTDPNLVDWLQAECNVSELGAHQVADYLRASHDGLRVMPSDHDVVFERFFDDSGGMQLVVHAPFGQRINRAWGLGPAQAFLRPLRLRASGRRQRRRHPALARSAARLPARRDVSLRHPQQRPQVRRAIHPLHPHVPNPLALEPHPRPGRALACAAAKRSRPTSSACAPTTSWRPSFQNRSAARRTSKVP